MDDYIPCSKEAGGLPMFSRGASGDMWVMLLEKAYAKLHGNYFTLRGGQSQDALMDLTGFPTNNFDLSNSTV